MAYDRIKYRLWDSEVEILRLHGRVIADGNGDPDPSDANQFTPFMTWTQFGADGNYHGVFQNPLINVIGFNPITWGGSALFHYSVKGVTDDVFPPTVARKIELQVFDAAGVLANLPNNVGFSYIAEVVQASGSNNRFSIMGVPP